MVKPGVDVKFTVKGTGWHAAGHLKGSKARLADLEHVIDEVEKQHRYVPRKRPTATPRESHVRTGGLVQKDLFGNVVPEPPAEPTRTHPFAIKEYDEYAGTMDELVAGIDLENTCGWCGAPMKDVPVVYECTFDGFVHCSSECQDAMDDWLMDHVIDPEGEIHDLKKPRRGFTGDLSDAQAGELHELKRL